MQFLRNMPGKPPTREVLYISRIHCSAYYVCASSQTLYVPSLTNCVQGFFDLPFNITNAPVWDLLVYHYSQQSSVARKASRSYWTDMISQYLLESYKDSSKLPRTLHLIPKDDRTQGSVSKEKSEELHLHWINLAKIAAEQREENKRCMTCRLYMLPCLHLHPVSGTSHDQKAIITRFILQVSLCHRVIQLV